MPVLLSKACGHSEAFETGKVQMLSESSNVRSLSQVAQKGLQIVKTDPCDNVATTTVNVL
jgi:hypothetical protein